MGELRGCALVSAQRCSFVAVVDVIAAADIVAGVAAAVVAVVAAVDVVVGAVAAIAAVVVATLALAASSRQARCVRGAVAISGPDSGLRTCSLDDRRSTGQMNATGVVSARLSDRSARGAQRWAWSSWCLAALPPL